jgi:predicted nucleic acid-binding protein
MSVLVDTSVWSFGLRRRRRDLNAAEAQAFYAWEALLTRGDADMIGPIRQEILSGISAPKEFETLRRRLASVPDLPLPPEVFCLAAEFYNTCRAAGIAPGHVDMTIAAAAHYHLKAIFTTDPDFTRYARQLPISLYRADTPR